MNDKAIILVFMLLLAFSSLPLPTTAVPSSRSLKSITHDNLSTQHKHNLYDDKLQMREMMAIVEDYPGPGANNKHSPPPPPNSR
ncbi:hypothetical protein CASFOL_013068 [Castilleja foliolosa]|uniref:Uncharacterized protein n=1 Tax=Castilleja foliolosa TaxID=1961234 RepID=A0ABD3DIX9_9LAMI